MRISHKEFRLDPGSSVRAAELEPVEVVDGAGRIVMTVSGQSDEWATVDELEAGWRIWKCRAEQIERLRELDTIALARLREELATVKEMAKRVIRERDLALARVKKLTAGIGGK